MPNYPPVYSPCGNGLLGLYWTNQTFANAFPGAPTWMNLNDGPIDFDWGTAGPTYGLYAPTDYFTIRWVGALQPPFDPGSGQTYTFYTRSDDGVRLWVNGQLLIDKWTPEGATTWTGSMVLTTNNPVELILEYFEQMGDASVTLAYSSLSMPSNVIPTVQLCADDPNSAIPPRIALTAPGNVTNTLSTPVTLTASVTPESATVNSVQFFNNGAPLLAAIAAPGPYTMSWTPPAVGVYNLTAQVAYNTTNTLSTETNTLTVAAPQGPVTISNMSGTTLSYGGGGGAQFVLLTTNNLSAPLANWTRLLTNASTPGTFSIPAVGSASSKFYRIKSE
jgi:hypothetical protein